MISGRFGTREGTLVVRIVGFYLTVVVFVCFWGLAFHFQLLAVFGAWFAPVLADTNHFVHDIALATWVWVWGLAMLVQLYRPAQRVAAMQVALLLTVIDAGVSGVAGVFDPSALLFFGPVLVAAVLHPARNELLDLGLVSLSIGTVSRERVDPILLGLVGLAVVPVVLYVRGQLTLQFVLADDHAALDHYATMAYYGLSLLALAALATLRNRGRRPPVYAAGVMAAALGCASAFRQTASGLDVTWSVLAVLWALAFVGTYEWSTRRRSTLRAGRPGEDPTIPS